MGASWVLSSVTSLPGRSVSLARILNSLHSNFIYESFAKVHISKVSHYYVEIKFYLFSNKHMQFLSLKLHENSLALQKLICDSDSVIY